MNCSRLFRNIILLFVVLAMGLVWYPDDTAAFSKKAIDFDRMEPIEINAVISGINTREKYLTVGEYKVYLIEFKIGKDEYSSAFVNRSGDTSDISSLRASYWKGKRVIVKGFKLSNGNIVAGSIKISSQSY